MGQTLFASFTVTVLAAALSLGMAVMLTRARVALTSALAQRDRAVVAEASTMRTLRLAVGDLQDVGMRLLGHAEQISLRGNEPVQDVTGVLAMTRQLLDLADAMQDHAVARPSTRALKTETIPLEPFISDAIASVTASLGPSRRHWRVASEVAGCTLLADRRALAQVLGRVLGNAARESRHGDWIDIALRRRMDGVVLSVESDGTGLVAPWPIPHAGLHETRGVGFGLMLSRVLMEAHGGSLALEPTPTGLRVTLRFPAERVARMPDNVERVEFAA